MSDGSLSQDEIDALLAGTGDIDLGDGGGGAPAGAGGGAALGGLQEALAQTVGQQQSNMAMITGREVEVAAPTVNGGAPAGLSGAMVHIVHNLGDAGGHGYVISEQDALKVASASMGLDGVELDDAALNAVQEVFSQVAGPVINVLSEKTGATIMPEPASASTVDASSLDLPVSPVYARYTVSLGDDPIVVYEIFEEHFASQLNGGGAAAAADPLAGLGQAGMGQMQPMGQAPAQMGGGMDMGGMQAAPGGMGGMGNMMGGGMPGFGGAANVQ